jgi:hypothetical protein
MKLTGMSLWHKVVITAGALAFIGGIFGLARQAVGADPWTTSSTVNSVLLACPLAFWWFARHVAPVRVADFAPPKMWLRIRDPSFANAFEKANPSATKVRE